MKKIDAKLVKELRNRTGVGIMDCKEALVKTNGNIENSIKFLREKGITTALKRSEKKATAGIIQSYVHMGGKIGVLVEVNCETDFVAKLDEFYEFSKNIAMQIAATNPLAIIPDDIPKSIIEKEKEIYKVQANNLNKNDKITENIITKKLNKFLKENCLMNQQYIKDSTITIIDYLNEIISKTGEKIIIKRFSRFEIGGDLYSND